MDIDEAKLTDEELKEKMLNEDAWNEEAEKHFAQTPEDQGLTEDGEKVPF